ncbi:c-type cytochrome [Anderseniella sp. Alg231-50]|uniref:c-type cytochrome n=1 Tax=Anderseniella sp. Alg231-50 TaxID=1922226 RepID=UPI000D55C5CF
MQTETSFHSPASLAASILLLALTCSPAHSQSYGDAAKGKAFVQSNCARCHAVGLNDDSHMPEAPAFRTLHNRYPIDSLAEAFAEGIVTGHPAMPQFELSIDTINDMLAYMKGLAGPGD